MKFGARIFKTGLAIILAMYVAEWLKLEPAMFAAMAATFAIQPSIYRTYQTILEQMQANVVGAFLAVIFVLAFGHEPFVIAAACMFVIAIILKLKLEASTIPLALVTIIIIMGSPTDDFIVFSGSRFLLIMIGVLSAFVINLLFIPPKYDHRLYEKIMQVTDDVIQWVGLITSHNTDQQSLKKDIPRINKKIVSIDNLYLLYKEERNYFLNKHAKARNLVVFKQMIATLRKLFSILKNLDHNENEFQHMPERVQKLIQEQVTFLTDYHNRILLRYEGKVNLDANDDLLTDITSGKEAVTNVFMDLYNTDHIEREDWLKMLAIVSHIVEYEEHLKHLDRLVASFFSYHADEHEEFKTK